MNVKVTFQSDSGLISLTMPNGVFQEFQKNQLGGKTDSGIKRLMMITDKYTAEYNSKTFTIKKIVPKDS